MVIFYYDLNSHDKNSHYKLSIIRSYFLEKKMSILSSIWIWHQLDKIVFISWFELLVYSISQSLFPEYLVHT